MVANRLAIPVIAFGGVLLAALVLGTWGGPALRAGETVVAAPVDTPQVLSAALLRRIAEAADGYRTGTAVFVVASYAFPYTVAGVFESRERAMRVARESGESYAVFGPYTTPQDFGRPTAFVTKPHCDPTIYDPRFCGTWVLPDTAWLADDVDSLTITVYHRSGRRWVGTNRGHDLDAVFFKLPAIDKFLIPYHTRLYGPESAARLRDSIGAYIRTAPSKGPIER